jgi:hypothetical protein
MTVTVGEFMASLLDELGINPATHPNALVALEGWAAGEGGGTALQNPVAAFNPLNTTLAEPGATAVNSAGVKAYTSPAEGLAATAQTLSSPAYRGIVEDLAANAAPAATWQAVDESHWGTKDLSSMSVGAAQSYASTPLVSSSGADVQTTGWLGSLGDAAGPFTAAPNAIAGLGSVASGIGSGIAAGLGDVFAPIVHPLVLGLAAAVLIALGLWFAVGKGLAKNAGPEAEAA